MLPITMGEYNMEMTIPVGVQKIMDEVQVFIVENVKTTRRYLRKINPVKRLFDNQDGTGTIVAIHPNRLPIKA